MIAHVVLFWGPYSRDCFRLAYRKEQPDPHYQVSTDLFWEQLNSPTWYRRCKNTKKLPGGGMLSYFVCHSLPVLRLNSLCQNFAENFLRFNCRLQGTDHPSLVVIHRRSIHGRIYHCKTIICKTKETIYTHVICAAFLDHPCRTHGQRSRYGSIDEDDSKCY